MIDQTADRTVPLPLRNDTILGVCEALGEDLGINPNFIRVPLAASVLLSFTLAFGTYLALGAVVLLSRLLYPKAKAAPSVEAPARSIEVAANSEAEERAAA